MIHAALLVAAFLLPVQEEEKDKYKPAKGDEVRVSNHKTWFFKRPRTRSKPFEKVKRGTLLTVLEVQVGWIKAMVLVDGKKQDPTGYVMLDSVMPAPKYDVTEGKFNINEDDPNTFISSPETGGAAAKGFTPEVEADRRKKNRNLDAAYDLLDAIQSLFPGGKDRSINPRMIESLEEFRKAGKLGKPQ